MAADELQYPESNRPARPAGGWPAARTRSVCASGGQHRVALQQTGNSATGDANGPKRAANCWQGHWRQATRWKQTESQGENRRLLDGSGAARADLRHVRQARRVVQQDEARSAARSARARSALAAAQAAAGWWWTNVPSGGWWSERSERGICVGCRFRPERKGWRTRVSPAFEAVRLYNSYNLYNVVQLFEFVFVSGPRLFGSNSKKGTGT